MKNFKTIFILIAGSFLVSCSSGGSDEVAPVLGCMDDCAVNYNVDATQADPDNPCLYSFVGTYIFSEYKIDGVSLFSNVWENPLVAAAVSFDVANDGTGIYATAGEYSDGTETLETGTFVNSSTQLIFYPSDGSDAALWTTTKINCLEFDGNSMIDGLFAEIELTYYSPNVSSIEMQPTENILDVTKFKKKQ